MMKSYGTNSVLHRASQFENRQTENSPPNSSSAQQKMPTPRSSLKRRNGSENGAASSNFFQVAFGRFQTEFASVFPNEKLPFDELTSVDDVHKQVRAQQARINEIQRELTMSKFVLKFLENINGCHSENKEFDNANTEHNGSTLTSAPQGGGTDDPQNGAKESKEQYVTVITLNDSTYGEIQRPNKAPSPDPAPTPSSPADYANVSPKSAQSTGAASESNTIAEPIYLNTVESQKPTSVPPRKRPPTPPRKPKFGNKLQQGSSCDIFGSLSAMDTVLAQQQNQPPPVLSKSDSLNSIPRMFQRRFTGPVQNLDPSLRRLSQPSRVTAPTKPKEPLQTFSLEKTARPSISRDSSVSTHRTDTEEEGAAAPEDDEDDIYDTVAPDWEESVHSARKSSLAPTDDDNATQPASSSAPMSGAAYDDEKSALTDTELSSHDVLSRCSSTDEVSNYVNIDYFLRKNSIGRSHSNILGSMCSFSGPDNGSLKLLGFQKQNSLDCGRFLEHQDTETTMSSMKSSDYDNFSSNENLIDNFTASVPNSTDLSTSLKSLTSVSTNESSKISAPKNNGLKLNSSILQQQQQQQQQSQHPQQHQGDFAPSSYPPPPMSTFTPPARDKHQAKFSFNVNKLELDKVSPYSVSPCSDHNLHGLASQNSTPEKSIDLSQHYAYTDIINDSQLTSSPSNGKSREAPPTTIGDENLNDSTQSSSTMILPSPSPASACDLSSSPSKDEIVHCQQMQWTIIQSIIQSETAYLDCLNTLDQYEKALKTTLTSGKEHSLISSEDLQIIFFKIADLKELHNQFLQGLKVVEHGYKLRHSSMAADSILTNKLMNKRSVGELFYNLASKLSIYSEFLQNYSLALETANRCSASNVKFSEIVKQIKIASPNGQFTSLGNLLHEPIARLQKNAMVIHDLLKFVDQRNDDEKNYLERALKLTQAFLAELNLDLSKKLLPPIPEKFQRRLVKDSFIIDAGNDRRKLRHLFLFNDVIVSAKYKASTKQKYTFEVKWFQMLSDVVLDCGSENARGVPSKNGTFNGTGMHDNLNRSASLNSRDREILHYDHVDQIKLRTFGMRYEMLMEEQKRKGSGKVSEKYKKKLAELESELVLFLPHLRFSFHHKNHPQRQFTFLMSSEYERESWYDAICRMQQSIFTNTDHPSLSELQRWVDTCRGSMNPNLGSFLLRTHKDESLCFGDLYVRVIHFNGYDAAQHQNIFFVIEIDSYGHYFKQALTHYVDPEDPYANVSQDFLIELEGSQNLRILCYEDIVRSVACDKHSGDELQDAELVEKSTVIRGKVLLELNNTAMTTRFQQKEIPIFEHSLVIELRFRSLNEIMGQFPANKICGTFGLSVEQVCKKEKSKIPYLILSCIKEVERRGLREVGVYRISGLASDIQRLRKAFEIAPRDAMWIIRSIDIHAVTGLLKLYLRELSESMVPKSMYPNFKDIRDIRDPEEKDARMRQLLDQLPDPNRTSVRIMIDHLAHVNRFEECNKMSLQNLATIFGPTMLKTNSSTGNASSSKSSSGSNFHLQSSNSNSSGLTNPQLIINSDLFTASTIDVLAQAEILYCFLTQKAREFHAEMSQENEETSL